MVGVPAIADIALLLRLLAHLGDHRVARHGGKETVDVDPAKRAREGDMLLRRQLLVAKEHDPIFAQRPPDLGQFRLAGRRCEIDAGNLSADKGSERHHPYMIVGHDHLPNRLLLKGRYRFGKTTVYHHL